MIRRRLTGSGVAVTLQRWENDSSRMCGDINRQTIVYTSAGHMPEIRLNFEVGRLFPIGRQSADKRASPVDFIGHRPMICRFRSWIQQCPQSADRPMSPDYLLMLLRLKKSGGRRKVFNLPWPDSAPIADWRRRWPADTPANPQAIFRPKNPSDRRWSLYVT